MKYIIICLSFFVVQATFAADYTVSSPSQVPVGYSPTTDGWYTNSSSSDRYRVTSSSSSSSSSRSNTTSAPDTTSSTNIYNNQITDDQLKSGNVDMYTIPLAISGMIQFLLAVAGTLSIVALIYHAVQMQINSGITGDSSGVDKAKKGMYGALIGFVISLLAWFIVTRVVELLTSAT